MTSPEPRLVRAPKWRRDEDGNVSFWQEPYGRWQRLRGWTGDILAGLERGDPYASLVAEATRLGIGRDPERKLREFLYTLSRFGYVEIPSEPSPPVYAGRYERVRELGRGGVGIADLCRDRESGEVVVVKRAWAWLQPYEVTETAMRREAEVMRRLDHPGIARLLGSFEREGRFHIVREYVDGEDLLVLQHTGVSEPAEFRRIATEIASILGHLHAAGFLLLDLRPANFLLAGSERRVRLMDVGLCRDLVHGEVKLDHPVGSKGFMSPEVTVGKNATVRSDLWGLGRLLFFVATGTLPARVDDAGFEAALASHPAREAILRCVATDPAARPASTEEVARLLAG